MIGWLLLFWNAAAFIACGIDKRRARCGKWRIPEKTLLLMGAFFGAAGLWCGMHVFRHKTRHAAFWFGVPMMLAVQAAVAFLFFEPLQKYLL